jgi:hypothetical protein
MRFISIEVHFKPRAEAGRGGSDRGLLGKPQIVDFAAWKHRDAPPEARHGACERIHRKEVRPMTREDCAHPGCRCDVEAAFGRYCSESCRAAGQSGSETREEPCGCGHPDCS